MNRYLLECCVDSVESAIAAERGGADRLELCANLIIGGTTPSPALYRAVRANTHIPVHVLLRPRFGDFLYTPAELNILKEEASYFAKEGANGLVIGCLTPDGRLDKKAMQEIISLAPGCHITLHRAFDVCRDCFEALKDAKELGVGTILTSGRKNSCLDGLPLIRELIPAAAPVHILVGGGVNASVIREFLSRTGAAHFHMSGKKELESGMIYRNPDVNMGLRGISEYTIWRTDEETVRQAKTLFPAEYENVIMSIPFNPENIAQNI